MAIVPFSVVPTVAPDARPPSDYQTEQASPASFGSIGAQELEQSGQNLKQAGAQGLDAAVALQGRYNEVVSQRALNQYMTAVRNITTGDPNDPNSKGLYSLTGADAMTQGRVALQQLDDAREQIKATLPNTASQLSFDQDSRRFQFYTGQEIGRHIDQQTQKFFQDQAQATINKGVETSGLNFTSPEGRALGIEIARKGAMQMLTLHGEGGDPVQIDNAMRSAEGLAVVETARNWAAQPGQAQAALDWIQNGTIPGRATTRGADGQLAGHGPPIPTVSVLDGVNKAQIMTELQTKADNDSVSTGIQDIMTGRAAQPNPAVKNAIVNQARAQGTNPEIPLTFAQIESGIGANTGAPGKTHAGVFQMGPREWATVGGTDADRNDVIAQATRGTMYVDRDLKLASLALGRPAQGWEAYVMHQQGDQGGRALLTAPADQNAVQALLPAYNGDQAQATQAITGNGGNAAMTTGQFLNLWQTGYAKATLQVRGIASTSEGNPVRDSAIPTRYFDAAQRMQQAYDMASRMPPRQGERLINGVFEQVSHLNALENQAEAQAQKGLTNTQRDNEASLFGAAVMRQPMDDAQLGHLVQTQQITPAAYNAIKAVTQHQAEGQDDPMVVLRTWDAIENGTATNEEIFTGVNLGLIKGITGNEMIKSIGAKAKTQGNEVEKGDYETLKTTLGGKALESGMMDIFGTQAKAHAQLWTQAQQEWNQRVLQKKENPDAVLADMVPRYQKAVPDSAAAFPNPRLGPATDLASVADVEAKTVAALRAGQMDENTARSEAALLQKYRIYYEQEQERIAAAKKVTGNRGQARAPALTPSEGQ